MTEKRYSLSDYLMGAIPELRSKNRAKSYEDYLRLSGKNPGKSYARALTAAITSSAIDGSVYGSGTEALREKGLADDGYAHYLKTKRERKLESDIEAAEEKRVADEISARGGYSKYLESHTKQRERIKNDVLDRLTEMEVTDPDIAFTIGINLGLDADEAREIGESAYQLLSDKITAECIELVYRSGMPLDELLDYAAERGLRENELKRLSKKVKRYTAQQFSDEVLDEIIEQANKSNKTY